MYVPSMYVYDTRLCKLDLMYTYIHTYEWMNSNVFIQRLSWSIRWTWSGFWLWQGRVQWLRMLGVHLWYCVLINIYVDWLGWLITYNECVIWTCWSTSECKHTCNFHYRVRKFDCCMHFGIHFPPVQQELPVLHWHRFVSYLLLVF